MSKSKLKVKQSYFKSFGHSPTFRKVMEKWFWIKPQRKRVAHATCEHGRVDYKALKVLAIKQANTVQDLGNAILAMEKNRAKKVNKNDGIFLLLGILGINTRLSIRREELLAHFSSLILNTGSC